MDGISAAGGMGGLANALESQRMATELMQRTLNSGNSSQDGLANAQLRVQNNQKPAAPLATGHAVPGVGEHINITV
ncbi:hypothetical protein [Oceanidesulfovibrio marinus]|uniref:Motility protein n=1 Tax=Oceanidesulfovibrio marinus TaxID=370038 RepID=A0A6P1ZEW8_9BACT|nr:hypothetical protein [Oceanidesulfovibrio marinus]QJT08642.1 hypothetical protein E8L03_06760 [Oceanidesulfovibrio marinus]TVM32521.1 hypothetical protein DQK91_14700 [Oceanidesulfovibrio marinus]